MCGPQGCMSDKKEPPKRPEWLWEREPHYWPSPLEKDITCAYIEHIEAKNHNLKLALDTARTRLKECEELLKEWSANSPCLTEDEYDPNIHPVHPDHHHPPDDTDLHRGD